MASDKIPRSIVLAVDFLQYEFTSEIPSAGAIPLVPKRPAGDQTYAITYDTRLTRGLCQNEVGGRNNLTDMRTFRHRCAIAGVGFVKRPVPRTTAHVGIPETSSNPHAAPGQTVAINAGAAYAYTRNPGPGVKALMGAPLGDDIKKKLGRLVEEEKFYNQAVHGR
jgi:hypothetical protein